MITSPTLSSRLALSALTGADNYQRDYIASLSDLIQSHRDPHSIRADVKVRNSSDAAIALKLSVLFNDTTFLESKSSDSVCVAMLAAEGVKQYLGSGEIELILPAGSPEGLYLAAEQGAVSLGFSTPNDDSYSRLLADLSPLIEQGRVIPRPSRVLIYDSGVINEMGGRNLEVVEAAPDTFADSWRAVPDPDTDHNRAMLALSMDTALPELARQSAMTQMTLPYLENVSLSDYAKILGDEGDLLIEFRRDMRTLSDTAIKDANRIVEFRRDIIDPRIARIKRRFDHISNMYLMRTAGTAVAAGILSLIAMHSRGALGGAEVLVGGAGAASMIKDGVEKASQVQALKDDPLFLLWKMSKANRA